MPLDRPFLSAPVGVYVGRSSKPDYKITGSGDEDLYNYVIGVSSKNRLIQLTGNGCSSSCSLKVSVQLKVAHLTTKEGQNHLMIGSLMCGSRAVKGSYMHDTLPLSGISCFIVLFS